jgi:hypothetical protein
MMTEMLLIQSAVTGLKTAVDLVMGFGRLSTMAEVNAKAIELQQVILTAQANAFAANSQQFDLLQKIRDLEEELARIRGWEETKKRYRLYQPSPGIFVYALKDQVDSPEPSHWICARCYENGKRAIIQQKSKSLASTYHVCFECKSEFHIVAGVHR